MAGHGCDLKYAGRRQVKPRDFHFWPWRSTREPPEIWVPVCSEVHSRHLLAITPVCRKYVASTRASNEQHCQPPEVIAAAPQSRRKQVQSRADLRSTLVIKRGYSLLNLAHSSSGEVQETRPRYPVDVKGWYNVFNAARP